MKFHKYLHILSIALLSFAFVLSPVNASNQDGDYFNLNIFESTTTNNSITVTWDERDSEELLNFYLDEEFVEQVSSKEQFFTFEDLEQDKLYDISVSVGNNASEIYYRVKTNGEHANGNVVQIPDNTLNRLVRIETGVHDRELTDLDMQQLTSLDTFFYEGVNNIQSLKGLEHATNLENLGFYEKNFIDDLTPLANMKKLRNLDLPHNKITDISPLAQLQDLSWVNLEDNQITDITPLANLTKLENLELGNNNISDISPLANLQDIGFLWLVGNDEITDLSPLVNLNNLSAISIPTKNVTDLSPLLELENLHTLWLDSDKYMDSPVIQELKERNNNGIFSVGTIDELEEDYEDENTSNEQDEAPTPEAPKDEKDNGENTGSDSNENKQEESDKDNKQDDKTPVDDQKKDENKDGAVETINTIFNKNEGFTLNHEEKVVSVDLTEQKDTNVLKLNKDQIAVLKSENIALHVSNHEVSATIPASVFKNSDEEVVIEFKEVDQVPNSLSATYDFSIKQGGQYIHTFDEGITLTFDVDPQKVNNPENVKVFYLNEETNEWELIGGTYKDGKVSAVTNHFSIFTVFETEEQVLDGSNPTIVNVSDNDDNRLPNTATNLFNVVAIGTILLISGFVVLFLNRRKIAR